MALRMLVLAAVAFLSLTAVAIAQEPPVPQQASPAQQGGSCFWRRGFLGRSWCERRDGAGRVVYSSGTGLFGNPRWIYSAQSGAPQTRAQARLIPVW